MFTVYIIKTDKNTFYTGQTNNLVKRINEHKSKGARCAKYLRKFDSIDLVYKENYINKSDALKREYEIKQLTHKQKIKLVSGI